MAEPWKCPECHVILAPHVSEHRCDPPGGVVGVTRIDPPGSGGTSGMLLPPGTTITVTGSAVSESALADEVQRRMLGRAASNWGGAWTLPGHAA